MDEAAFLAAIEGTEQQRDVAVRQVGNGFVLNGNIRYCTTTGAVKVAQSFEAVATTAEAAAESARNFLVGGAFSADV